MYVALESHGHGPCESTYLAKYDAVERLIKGNCDFHMLLPAHDFQVHNIRHIFRAFTLPKF